MSFCKFISILELYFITFMNRADNTYNLDSKNILQVFKRIGEQFSMQIYSSLENEQNAMHFYVFTS